jgi:nitrite reductase/ring-hydroxylating ferredoxin subunit
VEVVLGEFDVGAVDDLPVGTVEAFADANIVILRDDDGFYAMAGVCTHRQCLVEPEPTRLVCPCHDSVFDLDGSPTAGPARGRLAHYLVTVADGRVVVDTREPVGSETREPA